MHRVTLLFDGVQGLKLKAFGSSRVQIMGFDIRWVGGQGWDGINFEVEDYEDGRIHFFCSGARILDVEEAHIPQASE